MNRTTRYAYDLNKNFSALFVAFIFSIAFLFAGCQSSQNDVEGREKNAITKSTLVYGLGDDALNFLGDRLGCRVEALGMGDYSFARGGRVFHVMEHDDLSARDRIRANEPVILRYDPPGGKPPLEMRISVAQGVSLAEVEENFRSFMRQMQKIEP